MSNVMGKCCAMTASAMNGMKRSASNCRKDGNIADQQKRINDLTMEIGRLTVRKLDEGQTAEEPVLERYRQIIEAREEIAANEQAKDVRQVVCPVCGEKTISGMRYCGRCGAELDRGAITKNQ